MIIVADPVGKQLNRSTKLTCSIFWMNAYVAASPQPKHEWRSGRGPGRT